MKRSVFYSFHYSEDNWRVAQIRNIGLIEGNSLATSNDWEKVKKEGDISIRNWIDSQLRNRSCTIVLIGESTSDRKWIKYEIEKSWNEGKGLLGIYIHNLKNAQGKRSGKGDNPFENFTIEQGSKKLSEVVKAYDTPYYNSQYAYNYIKENIERWIEEAIQIRNAYK